MKKLKLLKKNLYFLKQQNEIIMNSIIEPKAFQGEILFVMTEVSLPIFYDFTGKAGYRKIKTISELTGKEYEMEDVIWYGNALQAAQYYLWNCKPVDMTVSPDTKRWAFAFSKEDHRKYIGLWNSQKNSPNSQVVK